MPLAQFASLVALIAISIASAVYWLILLGHVVATFRLPTPRRALRLARATELLNAGAAAPSVCIIIPAHNEAAVIGHLARSLLAQDYPRLSVVFSLDRCTDHTEAILREACAAATHVHIHRVESCPADWAGKVHAIHDATTNSPAARDADLLVFADADTTFDSSCIRACVALLEDRGLDMLSLLSTLSAEQAFERIVQPVAAMELLRQYPPRRVGRGRDSRPFANGQFMMFRREGYDAVGGHAAARDQLLEDIDLARKIAWSDRTVGLYLADGMLRCRMYPDYAAFRRGWKRIYTEAANCKPSRLRQSALRLGLCGVAMPLGSMVSCVAGIAVARLTGEPVATFAAIAGASGVIAMLLALAAAMRLGGSPMLSAITYPLGAAATVGILAEAAKELAAGVPVKWGGREYVRPVR